MSNPGITFDAALCLIEPRVQHYHWGKKGSDSLVGRFSGSPDPQKTYAELWFGAHPSAPSGVTVAGHQIGLDALIAVDPAKFLGTVAASRFAGTLPFLFKVLSIDKALSIQAHPDLDLARQLHRRDPQHYPDDNHKPEIAIAISELWMLRGFRPLREIQRQLERYPELGKVLAADTVALIAQAVSVDQKQAAIKAAFSEIVSADSGLREKYTKQLLARLEAGTPDQEQLFLLEFGRDYAPHDAGILSSLLMNTIRLAAGYATYIGPNIPHAYLRGDLVECMANSDNVVRAGLTPKFRDISTLISMLKYDEDPIIPLAARPQSEDAPWSVYETPTDEFRIERCAGSTKLEYTDNSAMRLLFCLSGDCVLSAGSDSVQLNAGQAAIVPASSRCYALDLKGATLFRVSVPSA